MREVVITNGVRTAIGKIGGSLKDIADKDLATLVVKDLIENRAKIDPKEIDHVILGQVKQSSDPSNIARVISLMSDIPEEVPAYTVNCQCGSGLKSIMDAYDMISTELADVIVAGGVESMSQSVYVMRNTHDGLGSGNFSIEDSLTAGGPGGVPFDQYGNQPMGITAENLQVKYDISRERQDEFAHNSQVKMDNAIKAGRFKEQILPVEIKKGDKTFLFDTDEHPFLSSYEKLSTLRPVFKSNGTVTAGNSSGRNDGAAAVLVMSSEKAKKLGYDPIVKITAVASSGCEPTIMGIGPVECTRQVLEKAGLTINDIDVIELNEAFAAQSLAVVEEWKKWGISEEELMEKLNPNGGAIAHGHPLACTATALTIKCMYELVRVPEKKYGIITLCCAGGIGVAMLIEKC